MQPLSRVKPSAVCNWGDSQTMTLRPALAVKVARCIAQWAEIETNLGALLGFLLHTSQAAAVAMYSGLENRAAQLRLINAAAKATVSSSHFDALSCFFSAILRPVMKERDKLAHWAWGHSDDLPDALLLAEPGYTLESLMSALREFPGIEGAAVPQNYDKIYVVRDEDLNGMITRSTDAKNYLRLSMGTVWEHNSPEQRVEYLRQLSNEPRILEGLNRLARARQSTPAGSQPTRTE